MASSQGRALSTFRSASQFCHARASDSCTKSAARCRSRQS
jgi:hypothetical protein